jgi:long-subunit acyl-CoA synthetase (AMP-forming)
MKIVFCTADKVGKLLSIAKTVPHLRTVVVMDFENLKDEHKQSSGPFSLTSFDAVKKSGEKSPLTRAVTTLDSLATICFTSGTLNLK